MTKEQYLKAVETFSLNDLLKSEVDLVAEEKYPKDSYKTMTDEEKEACTLYRRQLWKKKVAEMKAIRDELERSNK